MRQVERDIITIAQGRAARPTPPAAKLTGAKPTPRSTPAQSELPASLPAFIVALVREANGRAISLRQVTEEATRRGLTAASRNPHEMVRWHAKELVKKHILRRAPKRGGLLLGRKKKEPGAAVPPPAPADEKPVARTVAKAARSNAKPGSAAAKAPPTSAVGASKEQRPLREVLIPLLGKSKRPMMARELAEQALAGGYRTDSTDFRNLVQVTLGRTDEVEKAPEGGYRLKKAKK